MADPNWSEKGEIVNEEVRTEGDFLGMGGTRVSRVMFANGETWDIPDDPQKPPQMVDFNSSLATAWRASNKTTVPTTRQGANGLDYQWNGETGKWEPAPGMPTATGGGQQPIRWTDPNDGSEWLIDPLTGEKTSQLSGPISGFIPGYGVQAPQRLALQQPGEAEYQQLQNQKLRQGLMSPFVLAQQQADEALQQLARQYTDGLISAKDRDAQMGLIHANLDASLRGTTPFQEQTQKLNVAGDIMGRRMSTGSNMAQGLLSGASGIYGNILGGQNPPTNFNPLMMAQGFTDQMGGGPEMIDLARAVLAGALGGQQPQQQGWG